MKAAENICANDTDDDFLVFISTDCTPPFELYFYTDSKGDLNPTIATQISRGKGSEN